MKSIGSSEFSRLILGLRSNKTESPLVLDGETQLSISELYRFIHSSSILSLIPTKKVAGRTKQVIEAMNKQVASGVPIYGVTSAYGGQAGRVLNRGAKEHRYRQAKKLSQSIVHVDVSTGPEIPTEIVRLAMLLRIHMLMPGYSAIRLEVLESLAALINNQITPVVGFYGTLGASGDLAHNGRILSALLHDESVRVRLSDGTQLNAAQALLSANIPKIELEPKEGLALVNGDNFSTATAVLQTTETTQLMAINLVVASIMIQVLRGSNRNFHPLLSTVRPHQGQTFVAKMLTQLLKDSKLSLDESKRPKPRRTNTIIQDGYSIRCLPQYLGPDWETLLNIQSVIETNLNAVSDNPLWTTPETSNEGEKPYQWVSGGNFLAMYMSDSLDKLRKILVHIVKQNDRHLARLINPHQNNELSANISDKNAVSQCTFKGLQTQMGMFDVYASILATPVSTAFGVHEEQNQDLTSHAMTSGLLNQEVLRLSRYALATNLIAGCQAVDLRGGKSRLSPATRPIYTWVRKSVPYIETEQPLGHFVELIASQLADPTFLNLILDALQ